jgi:predicted MFS family arabinose efflux permease
MGLSVYVLFAVHRIGVTASWLGLLYAGGSLGGVLGAYAAGRMGERIGVGPTIALGAAISALAGLLVPLAPRGLALGLPLLILAQMAVGTGATLYNITQVTLRQKLTPDRLLGRMNASMRFVVWGSIPVGSLIGGILGQHIGLRPTLWVSGIGGLFAVLWVLFSPVLHLREHPDPLETAEGAPEALTSV